MISNFRRGIIAKACYVFHECDKTNLRALFTELYKTIKELNSNLMTDFFLLWLSNRTVLENNEEKIFSKKIHSLHLSSQWIIFLWRRWKVEIDIVGSWLYANTCTAFVLWPTLNKFTNQSKSTLIHFYNNHANLQVADK